jgi:hypothetical protein
MLRYLKQHPGHRSREVLAAYTRYLNGETFVGSCVFHRTDGCGLPRELRSDTCNDYYCEGLRTYRSIESRLPRPKGFFLSGPAVGDFIEADRIRAARSAIPPARGALPVILK